MTTTVVIPVFKNTDVFHCGFHMDDWNSASLIIYSQSPFASSFCVNNSFRFTIYFLIIGGVTLISWILLVK